MFYPPSQRLLLAVTRVRTAFSNGLGPPRVGHGSGFFVRAKSGRVVFTTNRHNIDPTLNPSLGATYSLCEVAIQLREHIDSQPVSSTKFFSLNMNLTRVRNSQLADITLLADIEFSEPPGTFGFNALKVIDLADQTFFEQHVKLMDFVCFIGYPHSQKSQWWDEEWQTPIARTASIASIPHVPFRNAGIPTADTTLVDGLSFSGSSGSLVASYEKGVRPGGDIVDKQYAPAKILGVMSGAWREEQDEADMFRHSGLSYYTRATSILEVISAL